MLIRSEQASDADAIHSLIQRAFAETHHGNGTESDIVRRLRYSRMLRVSLVAEQRDLLVGHVAISPVSVSNGAPDWYGLGPISVEPSFQRQGIGSQLMRAGLAQLVKLGAAGCVVLGNPRYYSRFGFAPRQGLVYPGPPTEYFMALSFGGPHPTGQVTYHSSFSAA